MSRRDAERPLDPFRFVLIAVAGWMNQRQLQMIDYLREGNRVLREQLGGRRVAWPIDSSAHNRAILEKPGWFNGVSAWAAC